VAGPPSARPAGSKFSECYWLLNALHNMATQLTFDVFHLCMFSAPLRTIATPPMTSTFTPGSASSNSARGSSSAAGGEGGVQSGGGGEGGGQGWCGGGVGDGDKT